MGDLSISDAIVAGDKFIGLDDSHLRGVTIEILAVNSTSLKFRTSYRSIEIKPISYVLKYFRFME